MDEWNLTVISDLLTSTYNQLLSFLPIFSWCLCEAVCSTLAHSGDSVSNMFAQHLRNIDFNSDIVSILLEFVGNSVSY